jgi:hypothetical protein
VESLNRSIRHSTGEILPSEYTQNWEGRATGLGDECAKCLGDNIYFFEYFHGDNGAGLGASHQTGWTGLVAKLIRLYGILDPNRALKVGKQAAFTEKAPAAS